MMQCVRLRVSRYYEILRDCGSLRAVDVPLELWSTAFFFFFFCKSRETLTGSPDPVTKSLAHITTFRENLLCAFEKNMQ